MPTYSLRNRVVIVAAILCMTMPLTGCDWYTGFVSFLNNGDIPVDDVKPAKEADAPAPYYETEEGGTGGETQEAILFDNQNILAVQNGGTSPTFDLASTSTITKIETYHWNDAAGNGSTGTISLRAADGEVHGPWETVGRPGQGDVPNAYWAASPSVTLPAGSYTVIDSDPGTWSQNSDSGGEGFTSVYAAPAR